jgi:sugar lactone lactonase YvrE
MEYRHVQTIGGRGAGPDRFSTALRGIAVDNRNRVYAAGDSEVKVFEAGGALKGVLRVGRPPLCVAVARDGSVYVGQAGAIEIFDPAGRLNTWRDEKLLGRVTAVDFVGNEVLAGDASDRAIRRFDRNGKFLNTIGKDNPVNGLLIPNGVVDFGVDAQGVIHAANPGKHRVERYSPEGKLLGHIGKFNQLDPSGFPGCCNPTNVAVREGIYVTEKGGPRAKAYDFAGNLLGVIAADLFDYNSKNMSIAVGAAGRVYVADTVKLAILVFEPKGARP